jgi:hypothetical protein
MQLWMRFVDQTTMAQRREQMLTMNKEHIEMATALNSKIKMAIEAINPQTCKPSEIASLMKTATELERKARIDTEAQEELQRDLFVDPEQKKQKKIADKNDLSEVAQILAAAGVLPGFKVVKTTTTEITTDNVIDVEAEDV